MITDVCASSAFRMHRNDRLYCVRARKVQRMQMEYIALLLEENTYCWRKIHENSRDENWNSIQREMETEEKDALSLLQRVRETDVKKRRNEKLIVLDYATMSIYFCFIESGTGRNCASATLVRYSGKTGMQRDWGFPGRSVRFET